LLLYLWEHRDEPVSEYSIGLDVINKREDFDPKTDASVRVHVSRLRRKLSEYFEGEGSQYPCQLTIPQGAHQIAVVARSGRPSVAALYASVRRWWAPVAAGFFMLASVALWLSYDRVQLELAHAHRNEQLPAIWSAILKSGRLTRVICPLPVFFHWDTLRVRDVRANSPEAWRGSTSLAPFLDKFGPPHMSTSYTVASDTLAAVKLTRFLSNHGTPVEVTLMDGLSLDQYSNDNLIFLGFPPTNADLAQYLSRTNFYILPNTTTAVGNRQPRAGEPTKFVPPVLSPSERYGIIVALPGHTPGTSLILLLGQYTAPLASFLTSPVSIDAVETRWKREGRPDGFEVVVRSVVDGSLIKVAEPVAFRAIRK
jgi:hypothetical protein